MKKTKKFFVGFLLLLCAVFMSAGISACGNNAANSESASSSSEKNSSSVHIHSWISTTVKQQETCSIYGVYIRKCGCGFEEMYVKKMAEHALVEVEAQEATCTEDGWKKYKECENCDYTTKKVVTATGHDFENGVCGNCLSTVADVLNLSLNVDGESYRVNGIGSFDGEDLVIPATYKNLPVTTIENQAFENCETLKSVVIPDSVTYIGHTAFSGCFNLQSTTLPNSITTIPRRIFQGCTSLSDITFPDGMTSIGIGAFANCKSLTNIEIPDSVKYIGMGAFSNCIGLTEITIPESVIQVDAAFSGCDNLKTVNFEEKDGWAIYIDEAYANIADAVWNDMNSLVNYVKNYEWKKAYTVNVVYEDGTPASELVIIFRLDEGNGWTATTNQNGIAIFAIHLDEIFISIEVHPNGNIFYNPLEEINIVEGQYVYEIVLPNA